MLQFAAKLDVVDNLGDTPLLKVGQFSCEFTLTKNLKINSSRLSNVART